MDGDPALNRSVGRLSAELEDDGVVLDVDDHLRSLVLDELEYARRPPQFERRVPLYGAMVVPHDRSLVASGELVDLIDLGAWPLATARRFADGRSTYLVRQPDGTRQLACFRRSIQYEASIVETQAATGAFVIQRTPVLGVTRLFTPGSTVEWTGYRWTTRPNARSEHALLQPRLPDVASRTLSGLLELAVHWLSPGRVGATLVLPGDDDAGLTFEHSTATPPLSITRRHHYPALVAALMQTDLATVVDQSGLVRNIGVALRPTAEATMAVASAAGMRHRSAAAYTLDQPGALAIVVSEDGPVTTFFRGKSLSECAGRVSLVSAGDARIPSDD